MIRKTKEHREGGELNRGEDKSRLHTWTNALPSRDARFHNPCTWRRGGGGKGRTRGTSFHFYSIDPTYALANNLFTRTASKARYKKKGQCKMYRYYPLSMWHLQIYIRVGSETVFLSLRLTRNRLLTAFATLSMLVWILIMRSRVYLTLDFSLYFSLLSFSRARIRSKLNWNWKSTRSIIFEYFSVQVYLLRL